MTSVVRGSTAGRFGTSGRRSPARGGHPTPTDLQGPLVLIVRRRVRPSAAAALILLLLVLLAPAGPARAAGTPEPGAPYQGALLDWGTDTAAGHAERLGAPAAVYGRPVPLPMSEQEQGHLRDYLSQVSEQGGHALLTIRPEIPLDRVEGARAAALAGQVADVAEDFGGTVFIRFAPQVNASWVPWGQQPEAYTEAFRVVAAAMDARLDDPVAVWSPTAGTDYPFREPTSVAPQGAGLAALDTDGNGVWDRDDDPCGPYYPGDDVVDWVGLSAYHDETGSGEARNTVPGPDEFDALLGGAEGFYATYAAGRDRPLMVETGSFHSPGADGPSVPEVKAPWWDQVLAAASSDDYARIGAVVWNETVEERADGAVTVDWRSTADPALAAAFQE